MSPTRNRAGEGPAGVAEEHRNLLAREVAAHRDEREEPLAHQGGDRGREAGPVRGATRNLSMANQATITTKQQLIRNLSQRIMH